MDRRLKPSRALVTPLLAATIAMGAVLVLNLAGCQSRPADNARLYHQLGERDGIAGLTEDMLLRVAGDRRIREHFVGVDIEILHEKLTDQLCEVSGGPCEYRGDNMVNAHRGLELTNADFNALVEDLVLTMEARNIPTGAQNALLARLAPMRGEVVGPHPPRIPEIEDLILGDVLRDRYSGPSPARGL